MKICTKSTCKHNGQYQSFENFGKSKNAKDWYHTWCKDCRKEYNKQNKKKIKIYNKQYNLNHKKEIKEYDLLHKMRGNEYSRQWKQKLAKYNTFNDKLILYESIRSDPNNIKLLQVKCAVCQNYFNPTNSQVHNRISAINGQKNGENKLYCSDLCKKSCSVFRQKIRSKLESIVEPRDPELTKDLIKIVLERDNYTCQKCGKNGNLKCHHIEGVKQNPIESADVDNCITLCNTCHEEIHSRIGCRRVDLRCNQYDYKVGVL